MASHCPLYLGSEASMLAYRLAFSLPEQCKLLAVRKLKEVPHSWHHPVLVCRQQPNTFHGRVMPWQKKKYTLFVSHYCLLAEAQQFYWSSYKHLEIFVGRVQPSRDDVPVLGRGLKDPSPAISQETSRSGRSEHKHKVAAPVQLTITCWSDSFAFDLFILAKHWNWSNHKMPRGWQSG